MWIPAIITIRVKNNTEEKIKELKITYDGYKANFVKIKNIKKDDKKSIAISTINVLRKSDLKIYINEDKKYLLKENIKSNDMYFVDVIISKIYEDGTIEYYSEINRE